MQNKLFTVDEANRILPLVRSITRDAVSRYRVLREAIQEMDRLNSLGQGDLQRDDLLLDQEMRIEAHLRELRRLVGELEELGCSLRDYSQGVVDFPAAGLDENGFTVFCWALGERSVTHWHSASAGYQARHAVVAV